MAKPSRKQKDTEKGRRGDAENTPIPASPCPRVVCCARARLWRFADGHFRPTGPGPADDGPDGQQHPHGHVLGNGAADRRV